MDSHDGGRAQWNNIGHASAEDEDEDATDGPDPTNVRLANMPDRRTRRLQPYSTQ